MFISVGLSTSEIRTNDYYSQLIEKVEIKEKNDYIFRKFKHEKGMLTVDTMSTGISHKETGIFAVFNRDFLYREKWRIIMRSLNK